VDELLAHFQRTRHADSFEILARKVAGYDLEAALSEFQMIKAAIESGH
jgi:hypothetical protein